MTIKELCNKINDCDNCPFGNICRLNDSIYHLMTINETANLNFTKSIIETAIKLTESEV